MDDLQFWDFAVIAAYFAIVSFIGFKAARRKTTPEELFLAGRTLGPLAIGFSLFASNISSDTLIGLPGAAYQYGISAANYEWMAGVVLMFTAIFVLPVLMRARVTTMPELMGRPRSACWAGCAYRGYRQERSRESPTGRHDWHCDCLGIDRAHCLSAALIGAQAT